MNQQTAADSPQAAGATKLVEVTLSAYVRREYTEVLEVPADFSKDELDQLVEQRYANVDGGDFTDDPDYWERGDCRHASLVAGSQAVDAVVARPAPGGLFDVVETAPRYVSSEGWEHLTPGDSRAVTTRWVFDTEHGVIASAQYEANRNGVTSWQWMGAALALDLEQSIRDNLSLKSPNDLGLVASKGAPAWAAESVADYLSRRKVQHPAPDDRDGESSQGDRPRQRG